MPWAAPIIKRHAGRARTRTRADPSRRVSLWLPTRSALCLDGEHRAGCVEEDALGVGPEDELADRGATAQPDDDELSTGLLGDGDEVLCRLLAADQATDIDVDPRSAELVLDGLQGALLLRGVITCLLYTSDAADE